VITTTCDAVCAGCVEELTSREEGEEEEVGEVGVEGTGTGESQQAMCARGGGGDGRTLVVVRVS
jgi:hypothetical protein